MIHVASVTRRSKEKVTGERMISMRDSLMQANLIAFLCFWFLGLALLYWIVKTAVRNGVEQANARLLRSVREIEKSTYELKKAKE